ncbi:fatty acid-binding protein 2-like isoform X2 [Trichoplusia ni]|uniref:Fatty acid-binding protein 2-like isoform X2 n=1 Tax=Trichoplusia ni TaxID=7111 RepID=A0A7E5VII1_TRINI|nr:fatty acid-binding protein 2-like isoform X2 [Trichoplusia ni]
MSFLGKTYNFVSQENFEEFVKAIGIPDDKIAAALKFNPGFKIEKNGDTYVLYTISDVAPKEVSFKSGVEFDDKVGAENVPAKSKITVDGNTVTQVVSTKDFGSGTLVREFNGDECAVVSINKLSILRIKGIR